MWRGWDDRAFTRLVHDLSFQAHGGTGLAHGYLDILEMDARQAFRYVERLQDARDATAAALKAASTPATR